MSTMQSVLEGRYPPIPVRRFATGRPIRNRRTLVGVVIRSDKTEIGALFDALCDPTPDPAFAALITQALEPHRRGAYSQRLSKTLRRRVSMKRLGVGKTPIGVDVYLLEGGGETLIVLEGPFSLITIEQTIGDRETHCLWSALMRREGEFRLNGRGFVNMPKTRWLPTSEPVVGETFHSWRELPTE